MQSPFAKADRSSNSTSRGWAAVRTTSHAGVPFSSSGKWSWVRCVAVSWPGQRDDAHVAGFLYSRGWRFPLLGWSWRQEFADQDVNPRGVFEFWEMAATVEHRQSRLRDGLDEARGVVGNRGDAVLFALDHQ